MRFLDAFDRPLVLGHTSPLIPRSSLVSSIAVGKPIRSLPLVSSYSTPSIAYFTSSTLPLVKTHLSRD